SLSPCQWLPPTLWRIAVTMSPFQTRNTRSPRPTRGSHRGLWLAIAVGLLAVAGAAVAVRGFSGARPVAASAALGRGELAPVAGSLVSVRARGSEGRTIPVVVSHGRLIPRVHVAAGERISVSIVVRRPRWERWALGATRRETLTVRTPVAKVVNRWLMVP